MGVERLSRHKELCALLDRLDKNYHPQSVGTKTSDGGQRDS